MGIVAKQERLDQLIYLSLMNANHLPDDHLSSPLSEFYRFTSVQEGEDQAAS